VLEVSEKQRLVFQIDETPAGKSESGSAKEGCYPPPPNSVCKQCQILRSRAVLCRYASLNDMRRTA
jgi:hypothetical protein